MTPRMCAGPCGIDDSATNRWCMPKRGNVAHGDAAQHLQVAESDHHATDGQLAAPHPSLLDKPGMYRSTVELIGGNAYQFTIEAKAP